MEDKGTMERKFGKFTLDELKKACEICLDDSKSCGYGCPGNKINNCRIGINTSVLELIEAYKTVLTLSEHWFNRADALSDKANKYDSVRNELIRTQELLKNSQDECRKRADKIKYLRENIDTMDDEYKELAAKLDNAEMARKSLEVDVKNLKDDLERRKSVIDQLLKEKDETCEAMFHYRVIKNSLRTIGKVMLGDEPGDHEKD